MISIAHNAVLAKIVGAPKDALLEVHRLLSYTVEGSEHMASFKSGSWSGKSSFFNFDACTFPTGFVRLVVQGLRKLGHTCQVVAKPLPTPLGPERPEVDAFGYTPRYDYQPGAVDALVRHGNVIIQVATGGGKSRIARMAYRRIDRPTLFLTTRGVLLHQMKKAVEGMGEQVAVLGDGEWGIPYTKPDGTPGRRITKFVVGMVQTLAQRLEVMTLAGELDAYKARTHKATAKKLDAERTRLKKAGASLPSIGLAINDLAERLKEAQEAEAEIVRAKLQAKVDQHERLRQATIEVLKRFELVIAEEAHEVSGRSFYNVMVHCSSAHYRMGLTATPFMKDDEEANMSLLASCGPVAVRISEELLIERGILARPYFKFVKLPEHSRPKKLFRSTTFQSAYDYGIVNHEYRNKIACAEVLRARAYGLNSLILVLRTEHGKLIEGMLQKAGVRAEFISGESSQEVRESALARLATGELQCLIGTTIMDVGVDVPSLGLIVLLGGGKAEVALRQRIGRGLREKKDGGPNVAFILDFYDEQNNHLKEHSGQRQAIIKGTPGFGENIVQDFDYVGLGLTREAA